MRRYARTEGALVEAVGPVWAAFSALTGETALLNDESAAILEILALGPAHSHQVCAMLAADSGNPAESLTDLVEQSWAQLIDAGLVREFRDLAANEGRRWVA